MWRPFKRMAWELIKRYFTKSGLFAVVPMDFYYPGKGKSGDKPPRKGFAPKWHPLVLPLLKQVECIFISWLICTKLLFKRNEKREFN